MEKILLTSRLEVLENFLEKGNVLVTTGETREEEPSLEGRWQLLVTMEQFLFPLESLYERRLDTQLHLSSILKKCTLVKAFIFSYKYTSVG